MTISVSKLTAFTRGNSSIIVCLPRQQTVSASSVVYHEVNVAPNLEQRINVSDFSRKYLMIQNLSTHLNYSVELEFALTCGQNRKSEPTYVVTGRKGNLLFVSKLNFSLLGRTNKKFPLTK